MQWFLLAAAMQKSLIAKFNSTLFLSAPGWSDETDQYLYRVYTWAGT
jgi:hypothetical protein